MHDDMGIKNFFILKISNIQYQHFWKLSWPFYNTLWKEALF